MTNVRGHVLGTCPFFLGRVLVVALALLLALGRVLVRAAPVVALALAFAAAVRLGFPPGLMACLGLSVPLHQFNF